MCVDVSDSSTKKRFILDEMQHLFIRGCRNLRQILQSAQDDIAILQTAQGQFANDKTVSQHPACVQEVRQFSLAMPQMINPYRCVNQDHAGSDWRRGT